MKSKHPLSWLFILISVCWLLIYNQSVQAAPELTIGNYQLVSSKRVTRTVFEYTYKASVTNTGDDAVGVSATLSISTSGVTVLDNKLDFGNVSNSASSTSSDTFSIRHDRSYTFDPNTLVWNFQYQQARPEVIWNTPSLNVEVLNGTVVVKSASFRVSQSIINPVFKIETISGVAPIDLTNLIEIQSSKSSALTVGDEVQVGVNFVIASNIPAGDYQATLHVQYGTMELLQPLEIHLKVKEGSAQIIPQGLAVATQDRIIIDPEDGGQYIKDAVRIVVNEGADMNAVKSLVANLGGFFEGEMERYNFFQLRFLDIESAETLDFLINQLQNDPNIMVASRDFINDARQLSYPDDTEYENNEWIEQFGAIGNNAHLLALKIFSAWNEVYSEIDPKDAKKIKIAIIDTGFDREHIDLKDNINILLSYELFEGKDKEHGTMVAGVVGAVADNREGIAGIVWNPELILREPLLNSSAFVIEELEWALLAGAKVINYSYGKSYPKDIKSLPPKSLDILLFNKFLSKCSLLDLLANRCAKNALFVFPVENPRNMQLAEDIVDDYPAALSLTHDNVISVGGFESDLNELIRFGEGGKVDVAAPNSAYTTSPGDGYKSDVGTSYSAPMITGIAGLLLTKNENLTPQEIKKIIITGACLGNNQIQGQIPTSDHVIFAANAYESLKLANTPDATCTNVEGHGSIEIKRNDLNGNPLPSTIATTAQLDDLGPKTENPALFENIKVSAHPHIIKVTNLPEYIERVAFCSESGCVPGESGSLYFPATCNGTVCEKQIYVKNGELTKVHFLYKDCAIGYVKAANGIECVSDTPPPTPTGKLNDTGITTCSNDTTNGLACPVAGFPGQDGEHGRDALAKAGLLQKVGGGSAGFDFTKLDSNGNPLPASATSWNCVKDNVTGLIWEVKTDDDGLRDKDNTYSWYEPDNSKTGGHAGLQNGGSCTGSDCDTHGYMQTVNAQGLCGASDWRMPDVNELLSIVNNAGVPITIDIGYFPNTQPDFFAWSSLPHAVVLSSAWYVGFDYGYVDHIDKYASLHIRLVRGGQ